MPNPYPLTALDPAQLCRARLRLCWDLLSQVGEHLDCLPREARPHIADSLAQLALAKAVLEEATSAATERSPSCSKVLRPAGPGAPQPETAAWN
jgi:hypothetical protein